MKVLLMCYECSPYRGSEWAVGWGRLLGAAKVAETHVITSEENFNVLERARGEGLLPANVYMHTPQPDVKLRSLERKRVLYAYNYNAYHHWQVLAFKLAQQLHDRMAFDLVHQVNVCTVREPGYGWKLNVPFVWGPVGGTQNFPMRFLPTLSFAEAAKEGARSLANWYVLRNQRVRKAARTSAVLFGANSTNRRHLETVVGRDVELLLETGLHTVQEPDRARFSRKIADSDAGRDPQPLQLLWSGELQTRKALPILLQALARLDAAVAWRLDVLGDGPMRAVWAKKAASLGLSGRVRFLGRLPFTEAVHKMQTADLLCFTSLRDTSGNVVLEALAAGVPVICFDHQGAGDMVDAHSGVKIAVSSPARAYVDWAHAISSLASDPRRLLSLSHGATARARSFLWSKNHAVINAAYERLVNPSKTEGSSDGELSHAEPVAAIEPAMQESV